MEYNHVLRCNDNDAQGNIINAEFTDAVINDFNWVDLRCAKIEKVLAAGIPTWLEIELGFENTWFNQFTPGSVPEGGSLTSAITATPTLPTSDVTVVDGAAFSVGQYVNIYDGNWTNWESNTISAINGNVLTMVNSLETAYSHTSGNVVFNGDPIGPTNDVNGHTTTVNDYETLWGSAFDKYNALGELSNSEDLFMGYSIEGGFDNDLSWLSAKAHGAGKKVSTYAAAGVDAWNVLDDETALADPTSSTPPPGTANLPELFPRNGPPFNNYYDHDTGWRFDLCDEVIWEFYEIAQMWATLPLIQWTTNYKDIKQGINTAFDPIGGGKGLWWGYFLCVSDQPLCPFLTPTEERRIGVAYLQKAKEIVGSFDVFEMLVNYLGDYAPDGTPPAGSIQNIANYGWSLALTIPYTLPIMPVGRNAKDIFPYFITRYSRHACSDTFANTGKEYLALKAPTAAIRNITIQGTVGGVTTTEVFQPFVSATTAYIGPFPLAAYGSPVTVTYDSGTILVAVAFVGGAEDSNIPSTELITALSDSDNLIGIAPDSDNLTEEVTEDSVELTEVIK